MRRYLGQYFTLMKLPGKKQCLACIIAEPALSTRSWTDIKNYIHNRLQSMKRKFFHRKAQGDKFLRKKNQRGGRRAIKKEFPDKNKDFVLSRTTNPPTEHREMSPTNQAAVLYPQAKQVMNTVRLSMARSKTNRTMTKPPMIPTFTPLNALTKTYNKLTPEIARSTLLSPPYSPQRATSMPVHPAYSPQHATSMPGHLAGYSPHSSSPLMIPTFMPLNAPCSQQLPRFTPLNDRRSNMLSSFRPLNHSRTTGFPASPPSTHSATPLPSTLSTNLIASSQCTTTLPSYHVTNSNLRTHTSNSNPRTHPTNPNPTTHLNHHTPSSHTTNSTPSTHARSKGVQHRTSSMKKNDLSMDTPDTCTSSSSQKTPKRAKRLWSEAEQMAVRRQLGDIGALTKVPVKKDCDACLAAEPALRSRTWREVKYFVHNTIQSKKKRASAPPSKPSAPLSPGVHNSIAEWDAPVYLSL